MMTQQQASDMIIQVLSEHGEKGVSALDLFTEALIRLEDDGDPLAVCYAAGFEPDDICRINYH